MIKCTHREKHTIHVHVPNPPSSLVRKTMSRLLKTLLRSAVLLLHHHGVHRVCAMCLLSSTPIGRPSTLERIVFQEPMWTKRASLKFPLSLSMHKSNNRPNTKPAFSVQCARVHTHMRLQPILILIPRQSHPFRVPERFLSIYRQGVLDTVLSLWGVACVFLSEWQFMELWSSLCCRI